jgi:hypothetical protein
MPRIQYLLEHGIHSFARMYTQQCAYNKDCKQVCCKDFYCSMKGNESKSYKCLSFMTFVIEEDIDLFNIFLEKHGTDSLMKIMFNHKYNAMHYFKDINRCIYLSTFDMFVIFMTDDFFMAMVDYLHDNCLNRSAAIIFYKLFESMVKFNFETTALILEQQDFVVFNHFNKDKYIDTLFLQIIKEMNRSNIYNHGFLSNVRVEINI